MCCRGTCSTLTVSCVVCCPSMFSTGTVSGVSEVLVSTFVAFAVCCRSTCNTLTVFCASEVLVSTIGVCGMCCPSTCSTWAVFSVMCCPSTCSTETVFVVGGFNSHLWWRPVIGVTESHTVLGMLPVVLVSTCSSRVVCIPVGSSTW